MRNRRRALPILALIVFIIPTTAPAQSQIWLDWLTRLQFLEAAAVDGADAAFESRLEGLAKEMQAWLDANSAAGVPSPMPFASGSTPTERISALRETAQAIARQSPNNPFDLGRIDVNVNASSPQTPMADIVGHEEMRERNVRAVPQALNLVPGVSLQRIGPRNETGVFVRGFDVRQVPLYIDGIPVYVPYDGYVDLDRFTTYDLAEVQVSKGFTSPLFGPNAIGGAINLVTKAPTDRLHLDLGLGYGAGRERSGFANAGSRFDRFWVQGGVSILDSDFIPLSGNFTPNSLQPTNQRVNAYRQDLKGTFKVAWTPRGTDQYVFSYLNQQSEKGNPPYAGADPSVAIRYWQWPEWDKEGFYFSANKSLGETTYLRARLYYDKFDNFLRSFDDDSYSTQTRPFAFNSPFDDDTYGSIVELGTGAFSRQTIKSSFYFKDDTHREGNIGTPLRSFRDQSLSWGVEDTVRLSGRASAIVGFSADYLTVRNAEDFQAGRVVPFPTNSVWAFNPQAAAFYAVSSSGRFRASMARKTRLPTIKDRYSYRMGLAIPNPELAREVSNNYEVGYSHILAMTTTVEAAVFRSDITDSVQAVFLQPNLFQFQNVGQARHTGVELSMRSQPLRPILFTANYTFLDRKNISAPTVIPVDTPRHKTYGALSWRPFGGLQLLTDMRYEAGRYGNNPAGRVFLAPQFADAGMHATVDVGKGVQVQAGATNLLDRNYFLIEGYPEPGRAGYVNLRYRLGAGGRPRGLQFH